MTPIYQTEINDKTGNCMQAAIASLLDLPLEKVPHFKKANDWFQAMYDFLRENGYDFKGTLYNYEYTPLRGMVNEFFETPPKNRFAELQNMKGVKGYFFASVCSPKYFDLEKQHYSTHAVLINRDLNIVHDPNPHYATIKEYPYAKELGFNGIIDIMMIEKI